MHPLPMPGGLGPVTQTVEVYVESGGKQVHLGLVPPGTYSLEYFWMK